MIIAKNEFSVQIHCQVCCLINLSDGICVVCFSRLLFHQQGVIIPMHFKFSIDVEEDIANDANHNEQTG